MLEISAGVCKVIDPLGGIKDLGKRELEICGSDNFLLDPVRILRAFRFKHKLGFSFSKNLAKKIKSKLKL